MSLVLFSLTGEARNQHPGESAAGSVHADKVKLNAKSESIVNPFRVNSTYTTIRKAKDSPGRGMGLHGHRSSEVGLQGPLSSSGNVVGSHDLTVPDWNHLEMNSE